VKFACEQVLAMLRVRGERDIRTRKQKWPKMQHFGENAKPGYGREIVFFLRATPLAGRLAGQRSEIPSAGGPRLLSHEVFGPLQSSILKSASYSE
jgi:hypothetical protein